MNRRSPLTLFVCAWVTVMAANATAETFLVQDGEPKARIVITDDPPRMTKLAAEQLQHWVEIITGAKLPIAHVPSEDAIEIYVGRSTHTDSLGVTDEGLPYDAYRMKSGDGYLALIGKDTDFVPHGPWARNHPDKQRARAEWEQLAGADWGNSVLGNIHRQHNGALGYFGNDARGSFNAVNAFLHDLGVRFYMPGELGTVLPETKTIAMPDVDREVHPAFALRQMHFANVGTTPFDDEVLWYLRLGLNHGREVAGPASPAVSMSHGLREPMSSETMQREHPEYYALYAGKRATGEHGHAKPCLSSEGLLAENVRYIRAMFRVYDLPMVSVMPQDGFSAVCTCELCKGKEQPQRGADGRMSDYVWDYVNRVATEVYKTHPDKKISCFAYGTYTQPPTHIEKLSPNVVVGFVHGVGKHYDEPEEKQRIDALREAWLARTSSPLIIWEHYVFTHRGTYLPVYFPRSIVQGISSLQGKAYGQFVETSFGPFQVRGHGLHQPAFNHLNVYLTARCYWEPNLDVDAWLADYCARFYGPAGPEMNAFINYCEQVWPTMVKHPAANEKETVVANIDKVFALLAAAQAKAPADSDYAKRIALLADYLQPLHNRRNQLAAGRENVPEFRAYVADGSAITLDGKLDEAVWADARSGVLSELQTGRPVAHGTTFRVFWDGSRTAGALYVGIRCEESDISSIIAAATKKDDGLLWNGDVIELLLETQSHSYYQLAIGPNGHVVDLDRKGNGIHFEWNAQAEVASHIGDDHWSLEVRIPVTGSDSTGDPLNDVVGMRPKEDYPWYINVCRQRPRENGTELSAWSPTGVNGFHNVLKFGKLYVR